jgi:hypothetical protein
MKVLLLAVALTLLSCAPPTAPVPEPVIVYVEVPTPAPPAEEPPAPEPPAPPAEEPPAPEPPAAPVWVPEPWHIYVLDKADAILYEEEARPEDVYRLRFLCWSLTAEQQCRDFPADPWRVVGGGVL